MSDFLPPIPDKHFASLMRRYVQARSMTEDERNEIFQHTDETFQRLEPLPLFGNNIVIQLENCLVIRNNRGDWRLRPLALKFLRETQQRAWPLALFSTDDSHDVWATARQLKISEYFRCAYVKRCLSHNRYKDFRALCVPMNETIIIDSDPTTVGLFPANTILVSDHSYDCDSEFLYLCDILRHPVDVNTNEIVDMFVRNFFHSRLPFADDEGRIVDPALVPAPLKAALNEKARWIDPHFKHGPGWDPSRLIPIMPPS